MFKFKISDLHLTLFSLVVFGMFTCPGQSFAQGAGAKSIESSVVSGTIVHPQGCAHVAEGGGDSSLSYCDQPIENPYAHYPFVISCNDGFKSALISADENGNFKVSFEDGVTHTGCAMVNEVQYGNVHYFQSFLYSRDGKDNFDLVPGISVHKIMQRQ